MIVGMQRRDCIEMKIFSHDMLSGILNILTCGGLRTQAVCACVYIYAMQMSNNAYLYLYIVIMHTCTSISCAQYYLL